jgi:hypothetical protein
MAWVLLVAFAAGAYFFVRSRRIKKAGSRA